MKILTILFFALGLSVHAEPTAVSWAENQDEVDGYRIYKGDVNNRFFVETSKITNATVDISDADSLFVTSFRGLLESEPSERVLFEFQDSTDLLDWKRTPEAAPGSAQYFTRFKVSNAAQPASPIPNNSTSLPQAPQALALDLPRAGKAMKTRNSWMSRYLNGPAITRSTEEGPPVYPTADITFVGQRCRVGDAEPFDWYWASSPTLWERENYVPGLRDLPTPWIIAHRGGWNVAPEHTLEAYRMAVASGIKFIEPDVQVLQDGTVVIMHDSTISRTTTATGNVSDQTGVTWQALVNDDGARLPGWPTRLKCPTFDDMLREFGNRVIIVPEAKNQGAGAAIVRKLQEFNIRKDMVIIQGSITELAAGVEAGYPCMRMSSADYAGTIAAGIEFTGFGWNETAKIAAATEAGLKVIVWTTQRNVDLDSALAAGAIAAFSDDPVYQAGRHRIRHDPYRSKAFYHGDIHGSSVSLDTAESAIVVSTKLSNKQDSVLLGWASPVTEPENFTLDFSMKFTGVASDSSAGVMATQTTDRAIVNDMPEANKFSMNMLMHRDGRIGLHVYDGMVAGPSVTSSESAIPGEIIPMNVWIPFRLTVTPSQITLERLDLDVSASITNNQIRGAYLFAGSNGANVKFKSMTLTE